MTFLLATSLIPAFAGMTVGGVAAVQSENPPSSFSMLN